MRARWRALLDRDRAAVEADPLAAAREAASRLGCVVVMKGARTHVVAPDGAAWLFDGGTVGLATSGTGDTLAGIITALLARGAAPVGRRSGACTCTARPGRG